MTIPQSAVLYAQSAGSVPEGPMFPVYSDSPPTFANVNYPLGKRWITPSIEYVLTSFTSVSNQISANWSALSSSSSVEIVLAGLSQNLSSGDLVISNPVINTSSVVLITPNIIDEANAGLWGVVVGTGNFTITSNNPSDTTNFYYSVFNQ